MHGDNTMQDVMREFEQRIQKGRTMDTLDTLTATSNVATERLYLSPDGESVSRTPEDGSRLFCIPGDIISAADIERFGLGVVKESKAKAPAENKAVGNAPEDKAEPVTTTGPAPKKRATKKAGKGR